MTHSVVELLLLLRVRTCRRRRPLPEAAGAPLHHALRNAAAPPPPATEVDRRTGRWMELERARLLSVAQQGGGEGAIPHPSHYR